MFAKVIESEDCHHERSEGSAVLPGHEKQVPRFARDDNFVMRSGIAGQEINCIPGKNIDGILGTNINVISLLD